MYYPVFCLYNYVDCILFVILHVMLLSFLLLKIDCNPLCLDQNINKLNLNLNLYV